MASKMSFANIPNNTAPQWWRDPGLRMNVLHCIGLCLCPYYLGFDASLLTGLQALPQWLAYFDSPTGNKLGIVTAAISFPAAISAFFASWLGERYGRKKIIWFGTSFIFVGTMVNTFATSLGMYSGGRVILGFGAGMTKVLAPALIQEIAHPRLRPIIGAGYYTFYYTGSILAAWLAFATLHISGNWSWRLPSIFQIVGPSIVILFTISCPESPRWLLKKGKKEDALRVLAKYHANGDEKDPLVQYEYQEIEEALQLEEQTNRASYRDFVKTKANRHRLAMILTISLGQNWIGNGIINYYLSPILKSVGVTSPIQITGINGGLQIFNFVAALFGASLVERFGRRPLWLASTFGMLLCNSTIMGLSAEFAKTKSRSVGIALIPILYLFYGFYDIAWTPLPYSYTVELLPYALRTKGMAIFVANNNIAIAFNQFANPVALAHLQWKYYGVYIVIEVAYLFWIWFGFPETRNLTIEEVSVVLDKRYHEYTPKDTAVDLNRVPSHLADSTKKEEWNAEHIEETR